jgi:hypothetical protein
MLAHALLLDASDVHLVLGVRHLHCHHDALNAPWLLIDDLPLIETIPPSNLNGWVISGC